MLLPCEKLLFGAIGQVPTEATISSAPDGRVDTVTFPNGGCEGAGAVGILIAAGGEYDAPCPESFGCKARS